MSLREGLTALPQFRELAVSSVQNNGSLNLFKAFHFPHAYESNAE